MASQKLFSTFTLIFIALFGFSQENEKPTSQAIPRFDVHYMYQVPGKDLAERFGNSSSIGLSFHYKTKSNLFFEITGGFMFGNKVKEDSILSALASDDGIIYDVDGRPATIALFQRGFTVSLGLGYVTPILAVNPNSGVYVKGGPLFLQHKIRVEHQNHEIPSLDETYTKGYDRLSNGFGFEEEIGYYYSDPKNLFNFRFGINFMQAFTKNRRDWNYDERRKDTMNRQDFMTGFKATIAIPLLRQSSENYYLF